MEMEKIRLTHQKQPVWIRDFQNKRVLILATNGCLKHIMLTVEVITLNSGHCLCQWY